MISRRSLLYLLPGALLLGVAALVNGEFPLSMFPYAAMFLAISGAFVAIMVKIRPSVRLPRGTSTDGPLLEIGPPDAGSDPGWSWQAMTCRQERTTAGEQLPEVVWEGREFFVDATPAKPGHTDVLAYCVDVTLAADPASCLARLSEIASGARSWSPARREGCPHTVEGCLPAPAGPIADVIIRIRVDELNTSGSSRVRIVLTAAPIPGGAAAAIGRYLAKINPLSALPAAARAVVAALGVTDRYETANENQSDPLESSLLSLVGVRDLDEFSDDMLYVNRQRLAKASASTGSRLLSRLLLALLVVQGVITLLGVILAKLM